MRRAIGTAALAVLIAVLAGPAVYAGSVPHGAQQPEVSAKPTTAVLRDARHDPKAVLKEILSRKEFQRSQTESVIAQLRKRALAWVMRMIDRLGGGRLGTRRLTMIVAWATAGLALLALSWWLVRTLLRDSRRTRLALEVPAARRRSARAWAQAAVGAQDPREFVRCAYRAVVTALEEEGAWRADAARTPREHLRLLPADHRRRSVFADVARRFEEVWFGARTPTAEDTSAMRGRLQELGCLPAD